MWLILSGLRAVLLLGRGAGRGCFPRLLWLCFLLPVLLGCNHQQQTVYRLPSLLLAETSAARGASSVRAANVDPEFIDIELQNRQLGTALAALDSLSGTPDTQQEITVEPDSRQDFTVDPDTESDASTENEDRVTPDTGGDSEGGDSAGNQQEDNTGTTENKQEVAAVVLPAKSPVAYLISTTPNPTASPPTTIALPPPPIDKNSHADDGLTNLPTEMSGDDATVGFPQTEGGGDTATLPTETGTSPDGDTATTSPGNQQDEDGSTDEDMLAGMLPDDDMADEDGMTEEEMMDDMTDEAMEDMDDMYDGNNEMDLAAIDDPNVFSVPGEMYLDCSFGVRADVVTLEGVVTLAINFNENLFALNDMDLKDAEENHNYHLTGSVSAWIKRDEDLRGDVIDYGNFNEIDVTLVTPDEVINSDWMGHTITNDNTLPPTKEDAGEIYGQLNLVHPDSGTDLWGEFYEPWEE